MRSSNRAEQTPIDAPRAVGQGDAAGGGAQPRTADRLLEISARLFREKGYANSTTRELANRLGIQNASLYHHIQSKDELLFAISTQSLERIREAVGAVAAAAPKEQRLIAMIQAHVVCALRDRDMHATMLMELRALSPERKAKIVEQRDGYERMLCDVITADQSEERLRADVDARHLTLALLNLLNWTIFWFDPEGDLSAQALGDMLASIFVDGARRGAASRDDGEDVLW